MSKPKNRIMCPDCRREKLLFDTESKAQRFIDFNWEEITDDKEKLRIYYCPACCGYHISSHKYMGDNKNTERLIKNYNIDINKDIEFYKLKDKCCFQKFKRRKDFIKFIREQEGDKRIKDRVISYFDLHPIW